jgi:hypothetical protein
MSLILIICSRKSADQAEEDEAQEQLDPPVQDQPGMAGQARIPSKTKEA